MFRPANLSFLYGLGVLASAPGALCGLAMPAMAQQLVSPPTSGGEPPIVVTGTKPSERPSDQELTKRVETALDSNRYLDASRVTVTTRDGVVHLEGLVGDTGDLLSAIRTSNRVAGAKRVVNELDTYEPDGYGN